MASPGQATTTASINNSVNAPSNSRDSNSTTITVSDADFDGVLNTGEFIDSEPNDTDAIWTDFRGTNYYEYDYHRYMAGITTPNEFQGGTAAFFQLAAPTLFWMARWTAARVSKMPDIPSSFILADDDWVLLDEQYDTACVAMLYDKQTPLYRISGLYSYGHKNPIKGNSHILNRMFYPRPPWVTNETQRNVGNDTEELSSVIDGSGGVQNVSPGNPGAR